MQLNIEFNNNCRIKYQIIKQHYSWLLVLLRNFLEVKNNIVSESILSKRGEAVNQNSLLAAARSRELRSNRRSQLDEGDGPRCCGQGFFAYFLFPKKVGEKAVSFINFLLNSMETSFGSWLLALHDKKKYKVRSTK